MPSDGDKRYSMERIAGNMQVLIYVRTLMTMAAGFCAGTLGLTGMSGFVFFAAAYAVTSLALLAAKTGFSGVEKYVPGSSAGNQIFSGLMGNALSFVLFWTLSYALVHIY